MLGEDVILKRFAPAAERSSFCCSGSQAAVWQVKRLTIIVKTVI
jgi:hypothetical protein